jgi:hypothetical protein
MGAIPTTIVEVKGRKLQQPQAAFDFIDEDLLKKLLTKQVANILEPATNRVCKIRMQLLINLKNQKLNDHSASCRRKYLPFMLAALLFLFIELMLRFTILKRFP